MANRLKFLKKKTKPHNKFMDINDQAREAAASNRQHDKIHASAMDAWGKAEVRQELKKNDSLSESAREATAFLRQSDKTLAGKMQGRAEEG